MAGERNVIEEFPKQLSNFVRALVALAPSRNYLSQFLYVVRMNGSVDYRIMEEAYPDLVKDEFVREAISKAFGVSFTDKISLESGKYGYFLTDFIAKVFELFEISEFRSKVGAMLKEEYPEGLPNLSEEWLRVRIEGLSSEPIYGRNAIKVLNELIRVGHANVEELEKTLSTGRGVLLECLNLLDLYTLVTKKSDGNYSPSESLRKYPAVLEGV